MMIYRICWKGEKTSFLSEALSLQDVFSESEISPENIFPVRK
jgi:hypothetical protein